MADEAAARPAAAWAPPSSDAVQALVAEGAKAYFAARRSRIDGFVDRHFSLAGSARLHRHALGWDVLRAPANILLAVPNVALKLTGAGARLLGADRAGRAMERRTLLFETAVAREVQWLIVTDLLELPYEQEGRRSERDVLAETILASPAVGQTLQEPLAVIGRRATDPDFRRQLEDAMTAYGGTRAAASEITTALLTLSAGALAVKQLTPGMMSLGPALAAALAQQAAVASFPLGATAGGLWYGLFPVAASPALIVGLTGSLMAAAAVFSAFSGILADPAQRRMGLHHRRLNRLVDSLERRVCDGVDHGFTVRDHYVARLLDVFDIVASAYRVARA